MELKDIKEFEALETHDVMYLDKFNTVRKVRGGWIYTTYMGSESERYSCSISSVFVPHAERGD